MITAAFLVLTALALFELGSAMSAVAMKRCPADTFLFGRVYAREAAWAFVALAVLLWLGFMNAVIRRFFPKAPPNKFGMPWKPETARTLWAFALLAGGAMYVTNATPFCLGRAGTHRQALPLGSFRENSWEDVKQIFVDCDARRRSPDLSYILTFADGGSLDIADAWPVNREEASRFQAKLAGRPFVFAANVTPNCPYGSWLGQKP